MSRVIGRRLWAIAEGYIPKGSHGPEPEMTIPPQRTRHLRFNDLSDQEPIPRGTDFASLIESDTPIVVQHTRLDSRQAQNALMTTVAFAAE